MDQFFNKWGIVLYDSRAKKYALLDQTNLPDHIKQKLQSYKYAIMLIVGAAFLLAAHARLWTFGLSSALIIFGWRWRAKLGDDLDSRLKPYFDEQKIS